MKRFMPDMRHDRGSALVSAVAVAIIGIALTTIVVTQAIVVTRDSVRDRVRTTEVHSAEGALDAAMSELATSSPCPGPTWSPQTVGTGTSATTVTVTIKYYTGNTLLTCTNGTLSGTPNKAVVTSKSVPVASGTSLPPTRTFEASVKLVPQSSSIPGTAVFSSGALTTNSAFTVSALDASEPAALWVDNGDYTCSANVQVSGSVYVVAGKATMNQNCTVSDDMWVKGNFENCCAVPSNVWQIGGNLTIRNGNLLLPNATRIKGDLRVSGTVPWDPSNIWWVDKWEESTIGGSSCASNLPTQCTTWTDYAPVGMPQVNYVLADWQPTPAPDSKVFTVKYKADFGLAILKSWGLENPAANDWNGIDKKNKIVADPCNIQSYMTNTPVQLPAPGSTTPTIYDMRDCQFKAGGSSTPTTVQLNADIAIFVNSVQSTNGIRFVAANGANYRLWLIVPWGSGATGTGSKSVTVGTSTINYTPGNMSFASTGGLTIDPSIKVFLYTPKTLQFPNTSTVYGQMYGGSVSIGAAGGKFVYSSVGVPNVNLSLPTSTASGFQVSIVSKREVR
jgi:hypothetical protein